jgi:hypothetical protein
MGTRLLRTRWSAAGLAFFLALTACTARVTGPSGTSSRPPGAGSAPRSLDQQEKVNRKQAEDEVRRLLGLVQLPPGAVALGSAPAALPGPGTPAVSTYASVARFWRVPLSFSALDGYLVNHPPAGLTEESSNSGFADGTIIQSYAWWSPAQGPSQGGQLSIQVAPTKGSGELSYLRVDAGSQWLDPHPIRDGASGALLRLETGEACPARWGFTGVRNDEADELDRVLAPNGTPTSGRLCVYPGSAGGPFALLRQRTLSRAEATRLAAAAHSVELGHADNSVTNCPAFPGSTIVLVLTYPNRRAVNLLIRTGGCSTASNGRVVASASASLAALEDLVNQPAG